MNTGSERAVGMAMDRTNTPYSAYEGQRIVDMSENEQLGMGYARDNMTKYDADYQSARDELGGITSFTDEGVSEQYMNPYMKEVVTPGLRRKNEAFEAERAERKRTRGMSSAFGGRGDMYDNQFERMFQESQDEYMGAAYGAAYDAATGLHGSEMDRKISSAGAYTNLAQSQSQTDRGALRDLMATGMTERTRDQAEADFKYLEYLEERDWDVANLDILVKTLATVPYETSQTTDSTTTQTTTPSAMKTIAGVGAITAGAIMTGGASLAGGGTFWGGVMTGGLKSLAATGGD